MMKKNPAASLTLHEATERSKLGKKKQTKNSSMNKSASLTLV
jgi:hypothetical protein